MKATFYHFTSRYHLEAIRKSGLILPNGDSPLTPGSNGLRFLWLTSDGEAKNQHWIYGSSVDKSEVRLNIQLDGGKPGLAYFPEVVAIFNLDDKWLEALDPSGHRKNWWVFTEPIAFNESMIALDRQEAERL